MTVKQTLKYHALNRLFEQVRGGSFAVEYFDGTIKSYGDSEPKFTVKFNDDNVLGLISDDMLTSFGEAYMDSKIDISGDFADLISLALKSGLISITEKPKSLSESALKITQKLRLFSTAKENIARHYDLGNDFFRLWLDDSLTYSCAYFRTENDSLELAQQQKIDHSLRKLRIKPNETLLDIGCGWGSVLVRAAETFKAYATGITLSEEQLSYARVAIEKHHLENLASVSIADYAALGGENGIGFDKIISIGMLEHVGKENIPGFIETVRKTLKPGGLALLHFISGMKDGLTNKWITKYIFPGGYIPTLSEVMLQLEKQNLKIWDIENLAPHYRLTLDEWSKRFELSIPEISERFDERFIRMWRLYLRTSSAAFREGSVGVHQILVSRGQPDDLPPTREDLYFANQK
jgi:cyclopropane-fatty-acyl-phospholipid synthase